jgi:pyruvate dehydrogenase E2 component (dihydrolipoamide acetyltransferase)
MKRFVKLVAVAFLVAVVIAQWRQIKELLDRQIQGGGREEPGSEDPGPVREPAGGATRRADEVGQAGEAESRVQATPAAERAAEELGVDFSQVEGTGSGGRITVKDVRRAAEER